ncbi:MAG: hypothetical protein M3460_27640 [Actinomycetota bacterium]|nr:hypothetical protein [Actinomycetota bacterium]
MPAAQYPPGSNPDGRGDLTDGEHATQPAIAPESTRASASVDHLGVEAAALGTLVAVFGVFAAAVVADEHAGSGTSGLRPWRLRGEPPAEATPEPR